MATGRIRLYPPHPGYIAPRDVVPLAEELRDGGLDVSIQLPPGDRRYSTPWDVLYIYLDEIADAAQILAVMAAAVAWAKRRWSGRRKRRALNTETLLIVIGPDGEVLRRIHLEGGEPRELTSDEQVVEEMARAFDRREGVRKGVPSRRKATKIVKSTRSKARPSSAKPSVKKPRT
jgi:hypothetical protein